MSRDTFTLCCIDEWVLRGLFTHGKAKERTAKNQFTKGVNIAAPHSD